jgi:hypothetical protein
LTPHRADHSVLVIATDPMLAAIVGVLVESTNLRVAFPDDGERAEDALARIKPLAAVLVDAAADESASDVFVARARKRRMPVLLFGRRQRIEERRAWVHSNAMPTFVLPDDTAALQLVLRTFPESRASRDRRSRTDGAQGPSATFLDPKGTRWAVYDRRADDRGSVRRRFVSESGEVRGCDLPLGQEATISPGALQSQLANAAPETAYPSRRSER